MGKLLYLISVFFYLPLAALNYKVTPLVSDLGLAPNVDPNLQNPWGLFFVPNGNLWVADNGTNVSTVYKPDGTVIPFVVNVSGSPTGALLNPTHSIFLISGQPANFLFSSETGQILGFNSAVDPNNAIIAIDNSSTGAVYKGLELTKSCCNKASLFATDFHNGKIDVFNSNFQLSGIIKDNTIPAGYAPFNVQAINGKLYVTFAKQLPPLNHDDDPGLGHGYVDVFSFNGAFLKRLISQGNLNSPWGLALAPSNFGEFSGALLIGNFGDGKINAYNIDTGAYLGQLTDSIGNPIIIDGLWALEFDAKGTLYFSSGPNGEANGLVGTITPL